MPPFLHSLLGVFVTVLGAVLGIGLWVLPCWTVGVKLLFGGCSFPVSILGPVIAFFGTVLVGLLGFMPRFLRRLLGGALRVIFLFGSLFLGAWLGERLHGSVGHDVGLVVSAVLILPVWFWLICRSSSEQSSAPPPA